MIKIFIFCIVFCTSPSWLWAASEVQEKSEVVTLRLPPDIAKMQYVKELYVKAYSSIGYEINWYNVGSVRELELVNQAKLAGALARHPVIEQEFPELIRIPFKLFDFKLLKVSDRLRCGYCLDEDINSIIYAKGTRISAKHAQSLRLTMDKLTINNPSKLNQMILKRRVDSVLIMDFQLDNEISENHQIIVETISNEYDYHYISPAYKYLQKPLTDAFAKLEQNGTVAKLQKKYKMTGENKLKEIPEDIKFISGTWVDYTNIDGSGVYWDIVDTLFDDDFNISKKTSIWARAVHAFEQAQADVLVGAFRSENISNAIYSSFHIDYELPLFAFARNEEALLRFKAQDQSLTVCFESGSKLYNYAPFIPKENIIETTLEQCNRLIEKGRVDILIEFDYNLSAFTLALPKIELIEASPLFFVFHNTPKGHFLKHYFDENIVRLARDDTLKKIFPDNEAYTRARIRP